MAYYSWLFANNGTNRGQFMGNYYLVANRLYPLNPSMDEELNRLLGWGSSYRPSYTTVTNEFTQNGRDSEYTDDIRTGPNSAPGSRTNSSSDSSAFSPSTSSASSPDGSLNSPGSVNALVKQEPKKEFHQYHALRSAAFPSAHRFRLCRKKLHCSFCKNNGERELVFASHNLKTDDGIITCPILRNYTCPICNAHGDTAHTLKYCPMRAP